MHRRPEPAPAAAPVRDEPELPPVPPVPVLSAREAARASLAAGNNTSLWWICGGLVVSVVLVMTAGVPTGGLAFAVGLAAAAVARAVLPAPGPVAFTVRSRALDVALLGTFAVGIGILSQVIPVR